MFPEANSWVVLFLFGCFKPYPPTGELSLSLGLFIKQLCFHKNRSDICGRSPKPGKTAQWIGSSSEEMAVLGCGSWAGAHLCVPCPWRCGGSLVPPPLNPMQFFAAQVLWKEQIWQPCEGVILESRPLCCGAFIFVIIGVMPVFLDNGHCSSSMPYYLRCACV